MIYVAPTIYEILDIAPPKTVNGIPQDEIDGTSMLYTFEDAAADGQVMTQFLDIMGSRGIYHDGWFAGAFELREPWTPGVPPGIGAWNPEKDVWELYDLEKDWTQANDLAAEMPGKLAELKTSSSSSQHSTTTCRSVGGLWTPVPRAQDAPSTPYRSWTFRWTMERMPEFTAPKLGNRDNDTRIEATVAEQSNGVLYALGGFAGGLTLFMDEGHLVHEYNLFEINRTRFRSAAPLPAGEVAIEVASRPKEARAAAPLEVVISANGVEVARGTVPITAPLTFTANDCLDIGFDWGSPVSTEYFDRAPFEFEGALGTTTIAYPD